VDLRRAPRRSVAVVVAQHRGLLLYLGAEVMPVGGVSDSSEKGADEKLGLRRSCAGVDRCQFERMIGVRLRGVGRCAVGCVYRPAVEAFAVGVGCDQRADFAEQGAAFASSSREQASRRPQQTGWGEHL
jgi:hypothetical protein